MINKRGISPLIATVLIIGFTIALAAIIMTWGKSFTEDIQESTEKSSETAILCATEVSFKVRDVCFDGVNCKITVENNGQRDINSFSVRYYKSSSNVATGVLTFDDSSQGNGKGGIDKFGIESYTTLEDCKTDPSVKEIELIPTVRLSGGVNVTCQEIRGSFGDKFASQTPIPDC